MNKSESKELGAASKRPSARRPASEMLSAEHDARDAHVAHAAHDAHDAPASEAAGSLGKRVHARRAGADAAPRGSGETLHEAAPADPAAGEGDGIELAASPAEPARPSTAARASARRPRAASRAGSAEQSKRPSAASRGIAPQPLSAARTPPSAAAGVLARQVVLASEPEETAILVERVRWSEPLARADEAPAPSLDHADFSDDFGLDREYESKLRPWLDSLCERHFHVELHGAHNIPAHGRALLVANHSRASVWDGIVLRAALRSHHASGRMPRWLVDDQQFHAPFLGTFVNRLGAVRACQENAERLLLREELVAVFPEGSKATDRPYEERHRLQRFGRGGYVKLALRTGTPVIPVAIVATEYEGAVWRNRLANASRVLSAPFAALRPSLPRMGALGMPPISARISIHVGAPIAEISRQDATVTQDDGMVHELNECVRSAVQHLVNAALHA
jgi:hypothetical protein